MRKNILIVVLVLMIAGCQQNNQPRVSSNNTERQDAAKKLFAQSILQLQQKDLKGAIASLEASIKVDPSDPNPYLFLGQVLLKVEQFDQAASFLDQTAKNFPNNGTAFYMLSIANKMSGKKLPAVLAARRSFDIFNASGDTDNAKLSAIILEELIQEAQATDKTQDAIKVSQSNKAEVVVKK